MKKKILMISFCFLIILPGFLYLAACNEKEHNSSGKTYIVTYDYNTVYDFQEYFTNYKTEQEVIENTYLLKIPTPTQQLDIFDGWYVKDTNTKIDNAYKVKSDLDLVAKWSFDDYEFSLNCLSFSYNSEFNGYNCFIDISKKDIIVPTKHTGDLGTLPVVKIQNWHDYNNHNLLYSNRLVENVVLNNNLKIIGEETFSICKHLKSVNLPNSLIRIETYGFGDSGIESINFNINLNEIGDRAFIGCNSLKNVTFTTGLRVLGKSAFESCQSLESVIFESGIESISEKTFKNCDNLNYIKISDTISSIDSTAFDNCNSLSTIIVDSDNETYDSRKNCNAIIETGTNKLILGGKNTVFTNDIESIGSGAFGGRDDVYHLIIPNTVKIIEQYAFSRNLKYKISFQSTLNWKMYSASMWEAYKNGDNTVKEFALDIEPDELINFITDDFSDHYYEQN